MALQDYLEIQNFRFQPYYSEPLERCFRRIIATFQSNSKIRCSFEWIFFNYVAHRWMKHTKLNLSRLIRDGKHERE